MKKFLSRFSYPEVVWFPKYEKNFLFFIIAAFMLAMFATPYPQIAMWVGFLFAAYAAIANDSIQTIGTFIASNQNKKWWVLWIFIAGIFISTMSYSWFKVDQKGLTLFYPKLESEEIEKDIIDNLSIRLSQKNNNYIEWDVKGTEISDYTNYQSNYLNEDYGTCLFLNKKIQLCHIYDITHHDSSAIYKDDVTYYKYNQVYFINLSTQEKGVVNFNNLIFKLYPDGIVDRDVSHARLSSKGFEKSPRKFHFLQIAAPIFLLILTRLKMPVSTTFILLTSFAISPKAVGGVLAKSMSGYILAFLMGLIIFIIVAKICKKHFTGKAKFEWTIAQWITSGTLWAVWLTQDAANIAVYLPREMGSGHFFGFILVIVIGLGILLYKKGGRIQKIVLEKSVVTDVRFATIIDFIYCIILFYFKLHSKVPMSTTWVFIGLLGGREIGMAIRKSGSNSILKSFALAGKDFSFALIGLIISIAIAVGVNDQLDFSKMMNHMPSEFASGIKQFFSKLTSF